MINNHLTIKELRFVENYMANGFNGSKSYRLAYGTENADVAKAEAWALLRKPKIQSAIEASERSFRQMAREMQMGRKNILIELIKIIKGDDPKDKLAGINTLAKLCGDFAPQKKEISFEYESSLVRDITKLSTEEILQLRNEILADL